MSYGSSVPGKPLAQAIDARIRRLSFAGNPEAEPGVDAPTRVCKQAGIDPRDLYRWRVGECNPSLMTIDRVLTGLGFMWWDVWNEDTVREHMLVVHSFKMQRKKGRAPLTRVRTGTREYMDLGTDFYALRRVQLLMEPPEEVAA